MPTDSRNTRVSKAKAGLPEAHPIVDESLRRAGIDPDRLSILHYGPRRRLPTIRPWARRLFIGMLLWISMHLGSELMQQTPRQLQAALNLLTGLIILQATCEALISATLRLAARLKWNHYTAGTLTEIVATLPELVVIAFIIPVSPVMAFIVTVITIYNNALVFSLYSFFLPKNKFGQFLMPKPITEAGTQILIGGGAMGLILGLVMLSFRAIPKDKSSFHPVDLIFISLVLFAIFVVYLYKLGTRYAEEEHEVRVNLSMDEEDIETRIESVYQNIKRTSFKAIAGLFLIGLLGTYVGGELIARFAESMLRDAQVNPILTALMLAGFAGLSEYVILWHSHRKQEYGIALANAFGGITQVMFLVLPFTLFSIAIYQLFVNPGHPELPLGFSLSHIFLFLFLFPTFYTLSSLIEEDHTLGILDTVIMTGIILFLIILLATYGSGGT